MKKPDEKKVTRREAVRLTGIAAALGAGLGIARDADGQTDAMLQHKDAGALQFKFYTVPDAAGKQELLLAVPAPAMVQHKIARAGQFQIKLTIGSRGQTRLPAVQKVLAEATIQLKRDRAMLQDKTRR
jgi:hypothetical protein